MIRINLLPTKSAKRKEDAIVQMSIGVVCCVLLAVICYFINGSVKQKMRRQQTQIADLKTQIDRLASVKKEVEQFKKKRQDLEAKIRTIQDLNKQRSGPVKLLEEFTYVLPNKAWITSYRENNMQLSLEGVATDGPTVSDFIDNLRDSEFFHNVQLIQIEKINEKDNNMSNAQRFSLSCLVNYLAGGRNQL